MKSIASLALFGMAQAGLDKMNQEAQSMPEFRSVSTILGEDAMQNIRNYGCWCFFDDDHGQGKGAPIDSVDAMCKNLHMGYDCAMMDYAEATGNDDCVPWEVAYLCPIRLYGRRCLRHQRHRCFLEHRLCQPRQ